MSLSAMKQALEALEYDTKPEAEYGINAAITALRTAIAEAERTTAPDQMQDWRGMDGAVAWHLIDRHADGWADVGKMMNEWLAANQEQRKPLTNEAIWLEYQTLWQFHPHEEPRLAADIVKFVRAIEQVNGIKEKP